MRVREGLCWCLSGSPFSSRMRWAAARSAPLQQEGTVISADVQPGSFSAVDRCELMAPCGHEVSDRSGRRCAHCRKCLHRDIAIEGSRATCHDCKRTFIGW